MYIHIILFTLSHTSIYLSLLIPTYLPNLFTNLTPTLMAFTGVTNTHGPSPQDTYLHTYT